jgi:hypothetical protein
MTEELTNLVEEFYFSSGDFNGVPVYQLKSKFDIESKQFWDLVSRLIVEEKISACVGGNPHIKGFSNQSIAQVLKSIEQSTHPEFICLYPSQKALASSKYLKDYHDYPYKLELARGCGQFEYRAFELEVLEQYRNDPRYTFTSNDIGGEICISDEHFLSKNMPDRHKIVLKTFGYAYDDDFNRYVGVFLRYLSKLTLEHQKLWSAREVLGKIKLHPQYYAANLLGCWDSRLPIFEAILMEIEIINRMCELIKKPNLFKSSYKNNRPKEFSFLIRPTQSEFNKFMLLLDKVLSDNINKKFFEGDIPLVDEVKRNDGNIVVNQRGTIQLLENWINKKYTPADLEPIKEMFQTFRDIRALRNPEAHDVNCDSFNQNFFKKQREIVLRVCDAIWTLRQIFGDHPLVKSNPPEIDERLLNREIWTQ